jgi:hypothetical protein
MKTLQLASETVYCRSPMGVDFNTCQLIVNQLSVAHTTIGEFKITNQSFHQIIEEALHYTKRI